MFVVVLIVLFVLCSFAVPAAGQCNQPAGVVCGTTPPVGGHGTTAPDSGGCALFECINYQWQLSKVCPGATTCKYLSNGQLVPGECWATYASDHDLATASYGCGPVGAAASEYTIGGTVSGLNCGTVVLTDTVTINGAVTTSQKSVSAPGGSFTFQSSVPDNAEYIVTVGTQPTGEQCTVQNQQGWVNGANITNVSVSCACACSGSNPNYRSGENVWETIQYYQQAIDHDPGFAQAYAGIADAYTDLAVKGIVDGAEDLPRAKAAASRSLQLEPSLAEPHNSLGVVAWAYDWDWEKAGAEFKKAAELSPSRVATHAYRASFLMTMMQFEEGITEGKRAVELNPNSATLSASLGYDYFVARRDNDSVTWLKKAIELDPNYGFPRAVLAADYALNGRAAEALAGCTSLRDFARSGSDPIASAITAYACATSGNRDEARSILAALRNLPKEHYVDPYVIAIIYSGLGENDAALEWLERTYREHSMSVTGFSSEPFLAKLHADPRFRDLIRKAHLPTPP